jgi:hypothetical protein
MGMGDELVAVLEQGVDLVAAGRGDRELEFVFLTAAP